MLGFTDDGSWTVYVPAPNGATSYQFASKTWGPNGSKYDVFAELLGLSGPKRGPGGCRALV